MAENTTEPPITVTGEERPHPALRRLGRACIALVRWQREQQQGKRQAAPSATSRPVREGGNADPAVSETTATTTTVPQRDGIVHKIDRLARNTRDDYEINGAIAAAGARLVSVSEHNGTVERAELTEPFASLLRLGARVAPAAAHGAPDAAMRDETSCTTESVAGRAKRALGGNGNSPASGGLVGLLEDLDTSGGDLVAAGVNNVGLVLGEGFDIVLPTLRSPNGSPVRPSIE